MGQGGGIPRSGKAVDRRSTERQLHQAEVDRPFASVPVLEQDPTEPGNGAMWAIEEDAVLKLKVQIRDTTLVLLQIETGGGSSLVIFQLGGSLFVPGQARFDDIGAVDGFATMTIRAVDGSPVVFFPRGKEFETHVRSLSSDPASPANDGMWYNATTNQLKIRVDGVTKSSPVFT